MKREIPELFVPFHPDTETAANSFEKAMDVIGESYSFKEVGTYLNDISLCEQTISFDGKDYPASRWAIETLCKICRLSKNTIFNLSPRPLIDLINNVVKIKQERVCIVMDKTETRVINIVKAE